MAWNLAGTYFENCNCDWVRPCTVTGLSAPATQDRCQAVAVEHIDQGSIDGVDVSGLTVALVIDTPKMMADGNWNLGLIIDQSASESQADALGRLFSGQLGGPMGALAPQVGKFLGIERAPMEDQAAIDSRLRRCRLDTIASQLKRDSACSRRDGRGASRAPWPRPAAAFDAGNARSVRTVA